MRVLYEKGLDALASGLSALGYETALLEPGATGDAVLFCSSAHAALRARPAPGGTLLLNARGMSAAQAAQAIRRRAQGPVL